MGKPPVTKPSKKRGLVKDTNNKASLQKDTIENLKCEQKANQADCKACCQWGATYLQTDLATCGATCSTLPAGTKPPVTKPSKKRGLVKDTNNKASLQKDTIENLKCEQKAN